MNFKELAECLRPQHNIEAKLKEEFTNVLTGEKWIKRFLKLT
mgnify:CR=1 FL=1